MEEIRDRMAASTFHNWIGMTLIDVRPGEVDVALDAQEHHLNLAGLLHGGVLATLADTVTGLAVRSKLAADQRYVTVQLDVHYLMSTGTGRIVGHGRAVRVGRQIAYAEAEIVDGDDRLLATAQATVAISNDPASG